MALVKPFCGVRPPVDLVEKVSELPYDVCNSSEAREIAKDNPYNFYHITKPEIDLAQDVDPYSQAVYAKAGENLKEFLHKGYLVADKTEHFYLYTLTMNGRSQTGIVVTVSIDDYENGIVKKHEFTREVKEKDRIKHLDSLNAQTGPVFLLYKQQQQIKELIAQVLQLPPVYDFTSKDEVHHAFRTISDTHLIKSCIQAFADLDLYIADGHHRAASAVSVGITRRDRGVKDGSDFFLSVLFPDDELYIMPYNRVVQDLNGLTKDEFFTQLEKNYIIKPTNDKTPLASSGVSMYIDNSWFLLSPLFEVGVDPVESLDVQILQKKVLTPILGIDDPRVSDRIDFIGGIRGTNELVRLVDSGAFVVAFSMFPTTIAQLIAVSDNGMVMPPKSTWFEPKLRSGMVIHAFKE